MKTVSKAYRKKDAMQLVTGQPVYMDDLVPANCLIVKLLRSPHANAIVKTINTAVAKKVPGIEAIFTWEDVPQDAPRYTQAGQTFPEASPRDRLLIDRHVRFVGDVVAIVAGKDEKCVDKALRLIKVECWTLFWITTRPKITPFWFTRRKTGRPSARLEPTTNATFVPMVRRETGTLKRYWQTAISSLNTPTIPRPASRP